MKLSDLLKPSQSISDAYAPGGFFNPQSGPLANKVLQTSINKSSPGFKQTTTNQSGTPVATDVITAPTVPTPEPIRDQQGNAIATPVDWYSEYAHRALQGDTNAQDWMEKNYIDETQPTSDGSIDFSTPTSDVAYSMEKLNELYGTKSPEDLWALRQKLRFQQSQASAGDLPASEYMDYQGLPGLQGERGYTYDQQMGINKSTADIFGTQVSDLDKFMNDYSKGETANGSSGGYSFGSNPALDVILGSGKFTKDQKGLIIGAIQSGQDPTTVILNQARSLMANPIATEVSKTQQGVTQLREVQSALADYYANGGNTSLLKGGYEKVVQKLGKTNDPKLAVINSRIAKALQKYRNAVSGTAYSVQEGADIASIFPGINKGKELNDALVGAGIDSLQSDIDTAYGEVLGADIYNALKTGGNKPSNSSSGISDAEKEELKQRGYSDAEINRLLGFKQVDGGTNTAIGGLPDAMKRIARNESPSGNYREIGPVVTSGQYKGQRALGLYQVMPGNIPAWSKEALGYSVTPQQFLNSPQLQEKIVAHQMTQAYKKYGNWNDVASVWFTGRPLAQGRNASDVLGTSGSEYVRRFNA